MRPIRRTAVRRILITSILSTIIFCSTTSLGNTVTWSDEIRLTTHTRFDGLPCIAQAKDGKVWVVWQSDRTGNPEIFYKVYNWITWTDANQSTHHSSQDISPSIFVANDGTIWIFWSSNRMGNFDIFYVTSSDGGQSWSGEQRLTTDPSDDYVPSVMQAGNGTIWVVWQRELPGNNDIFYVTSSDGGQSWSGEQRLTTHSSNDKLPSIIQTRDGKIWVFWGSSREGDYEVFYKSYNGSSWSDLHRLTTSPNYDSDPSVAQALDDTIWVIWTSREPNVNAYDELYYKISSDNGETWSESTLLASGKNYDYTWPAIAQISGDWKMWVTFTTNKNDNFDVCYKTSNLIVVHDIEITNVTPKPSSTSIYQYNMVPIDVTVKNDGTVTETFNVTAYYNSSVVERQQVNGLDAKTSTTVTFNWDTQDVSPGYYVISAHAEPVPGETDTADNSKIDGVVRVKIPGDVDGDGDVDIDDLILITWALGTDPSWPLGVGWDMWNPECDFNKDDRVDAFDLFMACRHYGMTES